MGLLADLLAWLRRHHPPPPPPPAPDIAARLLVLFNMARGARRPLVREDRLQAAAQQHADFMARVGRLAHEGIGDGDPWTRIAATGYAYAAAGEIAAWNQTTPEEVLTSWLHSPGHRAEIVGDYTQCGAAVAIAPRGDRYWCATFAMPAGVATASAPVPAAPLAAGTYRAMHGRLCPPAPRRGPPGAARQETNDDKAATSP